MRLLFVNEEQNEWTTGEIDDITDRTFTVRRPLCARTTRRTAYRRRSPLDLAARHLALC
jgi:hypothetical protein